MYKKHSNTSDLRILLLCGPISKGSGIERHVLDLSSKLSDRGHTVAIATRLRGKELGGLNPSSEYFSKFNSVFNYFYLKAPNLNLGVSLPETLRNIWLILNSFFEVKKIINDFNPDIIHAHSLSSGFQANVVVKSQSIPIVTTLHQDLNAASNKKKKSAKSRLYLYALNFIGWLVRGNDKSILGHIVIAISNDIKSQIISNLKINQRFIRVIYHGVDPNRFHPISNDDRAESRKFFGIPIDANVICLIGSLEWRKGHDILIKSLGILKAENIKVIAILSGITFSEFRRKIEEEIVKQKIKDSVKIIGFSDTYQVLAASDALVAPSRYEAFPLVTIEAMLCGVVPIRTPASGVSDQIISGIDGFIVPHDDPYSLAAKIKDILFNENLKNKMSSAALEKAKKYFTLDVMIYNIESVYNELLHKN